MYHAFLFSRSTGIEYWIIDEIGAELKLLKFNPRGRLIFDIFFVWQALATCQTLVKLAKIMSRICPDLFKNKTQLIDKSTCWVVWSHLGLNQGLPDYESGALTN